ncbi:probable inactive 2-oxoglutarate-dependent dioxygenase AOP2 [Cucurbita maxima]|uniref:Probable inactive 2-oxoglutarate-dependent dioxygenase AOP2 n=1 Tax=Cucurbita maxima TaxID=3661 RepID=A0A6J1JM78_CUCMA|nr:probable inactive 2-oxoglutarate-dependent dioxygenase AOP2 [Cucurbita maxima]
MGSETGPRMDAGLPVINFSGDDVKAEGGEVWRRRSGEVREALEEYGCFIAEYEGISPELRVQVFKAVEALFELPIETKKKNRYEKPFNGYVGELRTLPLHESLGIDDATNIDGVQAFTNLMWPNGNHHFSSNLHSFAKKAEELDQMVTKMIFESYGVEKYHETHAASITYLLRALKNKAPHSQNPTLCLVDHTDKSFTTMVYQDHTNGLEVQTKDGRWIQVDNSSPSTFVVIAGDAFKAWSNDRIESPTHKVTIRGNEDRYSLAMFGFSNGIVEVPKELIDQTHPLRYKPFDHIGLLHFFRSKEGFKSKSPLQDYCAL